MDRFRTMLPKVLDRIEVELDGEHGWRVALRLLEMSGLDFGDGQPRLGQYMVGPDDPTEIVSAEVRRRDNSRFAELMGDCVAESERAVVLNELLLKAR